MQPVPGVSAASPAEALSRLSRLAARRERELKRSLTEDELNELESNQPCMHCGGHHARACPRVKRVAFTSQGRISEVEYWPHREISWDGVVFEDQGDAEIPGFDQVLIAVAQAHPEDDDILRTVDRLAFLLGRAVKSGSDPETQG